MANQDLTTYAEVDPNNRFTVTAPKVDISGLTVNEDAYVYKDFGVDSIDGNFEYLATLTVTSISAVNTWYAALTVANAVDDLRGMLLGNDEALSILIGKNSAGVNLINLWDFFNGSIAQDFYSGFSLSVPYYVKYKRDVNVGANGTAYLFIYSDANRTVLVDTLTVALQSDNDFRYFYATQSWNAGRADTISGSVENIDLGLAAGIIILRRRMEGY